jgi:hypothetical protein
MRRFIAALISISFVFGVPLAVQSSGTGTFNVTYGTLNLGSWDHSVSGKSKTGLYDGISFNSSGGTGYATVRLTRPASNADIKGLFDTLKPPNMRLVVQARKNGAIVSTSVCEKSIVADFGTDDKNNQIEVLTFACTKVATLQAKARP